MLFVFKNYKFKKGWDYYTYIKQPTFFIESLINRLFAKQEVEKQKHDNGNSRDKN
jgi:hypothetical protein